MVVIEWQGSIDLPRQCASLYCPAVAFDATDHGPRSKLTRVYSFIHVSVGFKGDAGHH